KQQPQTESIEASVFVSENMGSKQIVSLNVGQNLVKAIVSSSLKTNIGEKVWLTFSKIFVFDKKSEQCIA
ncbi:MAG: hypothetical protein ACE5KO_06925, partial [Candidatus Bathyarchaeia archaeon]